MNILGFLLFSRECEINQRDIENEFNIKNPTVTGILDRLARKGFIYRDISLKDSRHKAIRVTEKSMRLAAELRKNGEAFESRLTRGFSPEEKQRLLEFLRRILHNISEIPSTEIPSTEIPSKGDKESNGTTGIPYGQDWNGQNREASL
jgi:DNA-binding MarR family transcriptional regulator